MVSRIRTIAVVPSTREMVLGSLQSIRRRDQSPLRVPTETLVLEKARLDPKKIAAYSKICGFSDRQGVPLSYPHMLAFPLQMAALLDPAFPYPLIGTVHLANSIRQHRELRMGETLRVSVRFGEALKHDKGQAFTLLTTIERAGECVWESSSTYLRLGIRNAAGAPVPSLPSGPQPLIMSGRWRLSPSIGKRYAVVSNDRNPIHTSRLGARLLGFRRPIAHGMWTLARSAAALLPDTPVATAKLDAVFRAPVFLPGTALLLSTKENSTTLFELRNGKADRLHVRGRLDAVPA